MLLVKLPKKLEKRLNFLAKKTGRTKVSYVKEAIINRIDDLEDIYYSIERIENPAKRWSLEDLEKNVDEELKC